MPEQADAPLLVDVTLDYAPRINFSFQQNAIPVIRRIGIRNNSDMDLHNVACRFSPAPEWAEDFEQRIALLPAQSDYFLTDVPINLSLEYLASLSERVRGELRVVITGERGPDSKAEEVCAKVLPVEVYAFDEWTGLVSLPEILAAFVTPNIMVVEQILARAADLIEERTASSGLDGYQQKSKTRVYEILDCIYCAIREQGIRYSNPPASFESSGQRIRFVDR